MKYLFLSVIFLSICFTACKEVDPKKDNVNTVSSQSLEDPGLLVEKFNGFKKYAPKDISANLFVINDEWMLVTAGRDTSFNTMTASWGGFGTAWGKPVAFMLIRDSRYTFEFLQKDSVYTLSFFDKKYHETMQMLGTKSGRDTNKIEESGLTPLKMPSGAMSFKEASTVIECRKLLSQPIDTTKIASSDVKHWYREEPGVHNLFFGEIIGVWKK